METSIVTNLALKHQTNEAHNILSFETRDMGTSKLSARHIQDHRYTHTVRETQGNRFCGSSLRGLGWGSKGSKARV